MKKTVLTMLVAFGVNAMFAQTAQPVSGDIPSSVSKRFGTDNPTVKAPNWGMDGNYYSAQYTDPGTNLGRINVYDKKGTLVHSDSEMSSGNYPTTISDYHIKNYPADTYKVWLTKDGTGNIRYYSVRNGQTLWFDKNGNYYSPK